MDHVKACRVERVEDLLEFHGSKIDVNFHDPIKGQTPLMLATMAGNVDLVEILLEDEDPDFEDLVRILQAASGPSEEMLAMSFVAEITAQAEKKHLHFWLCRHDEQEMLPPLPLAGLREASASASSWHSARNDRSSERGKSDPGGLSLDERASRLGAIREAERDELAAKRKALAKQASELSKAAAALAGAYRDRWRSPRVEADGDESAIASLRKEIQDTTDHQRLHPTRRWVLTACNIGSYDPSAAETSIWR
eukprot:symbB.v1.2.040666.t1/scaffold7420.1/size11376/2